MHGEVKSELSPRFLASKWQSQNSNLASGSRVSLLSIHVLSSQQQPWNLSIIPIIWVRPLRLGEVKLLAQHFETGEQMT